MYKPRQPGSSIQFPESSKMIVTKTIRCTSYTTSRNLW